MTDYGSEQIPDELAIGLYNASQVMLGIAGTLHEALHGLRLSRKVVTEVTAAVCEGLFERYGIEADESKTTGSGVPTNIAVVLDAFGMGVLFGALVGAEQELHVEAVYTDEKNDNGRTIKTPKARLRHNDPRLRRNRRGR